MRKTSGLVVTIIGAAVLVAGCGGGDDGKPKPSASTTPTTPSVSVPAGITLTDPGTTLKVGQAASAVYTADAKRRSVMTVTVSKIARGSLKDFRNFSLDPVSATSTPYYVTAAIRNDGPGSLGRAAVPVFGYDSTASYFPATDLVGAFPKCIGGALPASFPAKARTSRCLVFLVPKGATLASIQLRTSDLETPISWKP